MTLVTLIRRSLSWYRGASIAVIVGFAIAAAVITGSLIVGDSVRAGLRRSALRRLGGIDLALTPPRDFRLSLIDDLQQAMAADDLDAEIAPVLQLPGSARSGGVNLPEVNIAGIDDRFAPLFSNDPFPAPEGRDVAISRSVAEALGLQTGDSLIVSVPQLGDARLDTLFASRDRSDTLRSIRLRVNRIVDDDRGGAYDLRGGIAPPRNVFIDRDFLASQVGLKDRATIVLVRLDRAEPVDGATLERIEAALRRSVTLDDVGLALVDSRTTNAVYLRNDRLLLTPAQIEAGRSAAKSIESTAVRTSVYLADAIRRSENENNASFYAMVGAIDRATILAAEGDDAPESIAPGDIWINTWAAADLDASVGDRLDIEWLLALSDGTYSTFTETFTVRRIIPLEGSAADPAIVPDVEGITESETIDEWDTPFPVDMDRVTDRDERYWDLHRAAPRAWIRPAAMRSVWRRALQHGGSGWVTGLRIDPGSVAVDRFQDRFAERFLERYNPADAGLAFRPIRRMALESARGTTDFTSLFLGLGMFVIASGLGLAAMLIRLNADRRASQTGLMLACGFTSYTVRRLLIVESSILVLVGAALGLAGGIGYAALTIRALTTWWRGAIGDTPVLLSVQTGSLVFGAAISLTAGLAAAAWSLRRQGRSRIVDLLQGGRLAALRPTRQPSRAGPIVLAVLFLAIVTVTILGTLEVISPVAAFFISGVLLLTGLLIGLRLRLTRLMARHTKRLTGSGVSLRSAAANRGRSVLVAGLLAAATFIVVTVAINGRDFSGIDVTQRPGPTGGFTLMVRSSTPIPVDFDAAPGRRTLGFTPDAEALFEGVRAWGLPVSDGQEASCLNIARPVSPRVVGVSEELRRLNPFRVTPAVDPPGDNPWSLLVDTNTDDGVVPVFIDSETAAWQLHVGLGDTFDIVDAHGRRIAVRVMGLMQMGVMAGELTMARESFRQLFPDQAAPRLFLVETPPDRVEPVADALRRNLGDYGVDVIATRDLLNRLIAVQNTYLSTFLTLGGLGLVLGSFGLVIVLWRNALERRAEFALMLATGFGRRQLAGLLVREHLGLFVAGIVIGTVSALVATAPHLISIRADVPWHAVTGFLVLLIGLGLAMCLAAAAFAVRGRLIDSLRKE